MLQLMTPNERQVHTNGLQACTLMLNVFAYPFWSALLDKQARLALQPNTLGLLSVQVPQGPRVVSFRFYLASNLRTASNCLSFILLVLASAWYWMMPFMAAKKSQPG